MSPLDLSRLPDIDLVTRIRESGRASSADQPESEAHAEEREQALQELFRRYFERVLSHISRKVDDPDQAYLLAHFTFEKALGHIDRNELRREFMPWILTVARDVTTPLTRSSDSVIQMGHYREARKGFDSDEALAKACGIDSMEVSLWERGEATDPERLRVLRNVAIVVSRLIEYYQPEVVGDWLYGNSPDLGGRQPIKLLREGRLAEVLAVIEAQTSGAYI